MDELLEAIDRYQEENRLTDFAFSELIGLNPSALSRIRSGQRRFGVRFLKALAQLPELKPAIFAYVGNGGKSPQTAPSQKIAGLVDKVVSNIISRMRHTRSSTFSSSSPFRRS